jgi:hypothetical protein
MKNLNLPRGKGVYIWTPSQIFKGDIAKIVAELVRTKTQVVAIKVHDGTAVNKTLGPLIDAIRAAGIAVGGWGFNYLRWNPLGEAKAAIQACKLYKLDFYLIDAEGHAKGMFNPAKIFAHAILGHYGSVIGKIDCPIGLNSYRYPTYHLSLPWEELLAACDFVVPQCYWRDGDPVVEINRSKKDYKARFPNHPMLGIAGDMYLEHGIKPTSEEVVRFLDTIRNDPVTQFTLMWAMDQNESTPELWEAYASYNWSKGTTKPTVPVSPPANIPVPLYVAVVNTASLWVRKLATRNSAGMRGLVRGDRVEVWEECATAKEGVWGKISRNVSEWVSKTYLKVIS